MTFAEFTHRLELTGGLVRSLASPLVQEVLPTRLVYTLDIKDDPAGGRGPTGTIKFLGGRFLRPSELCRLEARRAAELLWVDGRVPSWVNLSVVACDSEATEIKVAFTHVLVEADAQKLERDLRASPENELAPFRIRGPSIPAGWRSAETDGRVSLLKKPGSA